MNQILETLAANARKTPERPALVYCQNGREMNICWKDFLNIVFSVQKWLDRINREPVVFILSGNSCEWVLIHAAIICGKGIVVPLDPQLSEDELYGQICKTGVGIIIYSINCSELANQLSKRLSNQTFISMEDRGFQEAIHPSALSLSMVVEPSDEEVLR